MKTYRCDCGNRLFFHSTKCVRCGTESGMCPACDQVTPLLGHGDGVSCGNKSCGAPLRKCKNYLEHICNRMVECGRGDLSSVCNYCATTTVIPDLSVAGNKKKWQELERAKHRVLYMLDELGVPFGEGDDLCPPATFEFKADGEEPVATGHAKGCITINIREADSAAREQSRVEFGEPQRTLIGHLRHELGHYVWDRLVRGQDEEQYRRVFGDERNPTYQESLQKYYADGPNAGWQQQFISAYATMHPW